jgi:tol-pal system protein YbgF
MVRLANGRRIPGALLATVLVLGGCATTGMSGAVEPAPSADRTSGLFASVQALQTEVQALRNQVEVQQHEIDNLRQRQRELYDDLDRRLRERERLTAPAGAASAPADAYGGVTPSQAPSQAPTAAPAPMAPPVAAPSQPPAPADVAEQEAYDAAFGLLKQSRYGEAIEAFKAFLQRYPDSTLAGNAQYWIAEAYYVTRDFGKALEEFQKVLSSHPGSQKEPDAMLKIGYTYYELGDRAAARAALEDVISRYPGSRFAITAENRLKREGQ